MSINLLLKKIKKKKWVMEVSRKFNWLVEWGQIQANAKKFQEKYAGFSIPSKNFLILNGDEYYVEDDLKDFYLFFNNRFKKDQNFFQKFAKRMFNLENDVLDYINFLQKQNLSHLLNKDLARLLEDFSEKFVKSMIPAWVRPDMYLEEILITNFKKELELSDEKLDEIIPKIATYPDLGELAYTQEPLDLLKIAKKIKGGSFNLSNLPQNIEKNIKNHKNKYCWLKGPVSSENVVFERADYLERLGVLLKKDIDREIKHILATRKQTQIDYKDVIKKYKIKGRLLKICEATRSFVFLRTFSAENNELLFFMAKTTLLEEISKRLSLKVADLIMLEPREISLLLSDKLKRTETEKFVAKRKLGFAIAWIDGKLNIIFGNEASLLQKKVSDIFIVREEKFKKVQEKEIKGTPASLGFAKGNVKIVLNHNDTKKVNIGDILVSSMTNPDFIIAMEKAAAFVTDEGGITCHAAIVAREFGVPCIVGTINATKVLKDGDLVEVDANKGVIKVL